MCQEYKDFFSMFAFQDIKIAHVSMVMISIGVMKNLNHLFCGTEIWQGGWKGSC
jgi:hypothetical protein